MIINVDRPTYEFKPAISFMGKPYTNSKDLVEAFLDNWDVAIVYFLSGKYDGLWSKHVISGTDLDKNEVKDKWFAKLIEDMYSKTYPENQDVIFTEMLHMLEPKMETIPVAWAEEIQLLEPQQFEEFFLWAPEEETCQAALRNQSFWDYDYNEDCEKEIYLCQMLRRKIFSLWGYKGVEDPYHTWYADAVKRNLSVHEARTGFMEAFHQTSNLFYSRTKYVFEDRAYETLEEFATYMANAMPMWGMDDWDYFVSVFTNEDNTKLSFYDWLKLFDKGEYEKELRMWRQTVDETDLVSTQFEQPKDTLIWGYLKWGTQDNKKEYLQKIHQTVEDALEFMKANSEKQLAYERMRLHEELYEFMIELLDIPESACSWEKCEVRTELEELIEAWENWENDIQTNYKNAKEILARVEQGDWEFFWKKENAGILENTILRSAKDIRFMQIAATEGTYKEHCEAFLERLPELVQDVSKDDRSDLLQKLGAVICDLICEQKNLDEVAEYYLGVHTRLKEIFDVKNEKDCWFTFTKGMISKHFLEDSGFDSVQVINTITKSEIEKMQSEIKTGLGQISRINYDAFYKKKTYQQWQNEKDNLKDIETKWVETSKGVNGLVEFIPKMIDGNCMSPNVSKNRKLFKDEVATLKRDIEKLAELKRERAEKLKAVNTLFADVRSECRAYETEWDKKEAEKKEKEKAKLIRKANRKKLFGKLRKVFVVLLIIGAIGGGLWLTLKTHVKLNGLSDDSLFFKNLQDEVDENGVLTLPDSVLGIPYEKIGNLTLPDNAIKVIIPEGIKKMEASYDIAESPIAGYTLVGKNVHELVFPDSLKSVDGRFYLPNLRGFYASGIEYLEGTNMFYECTNMKFIYLPRLSVLERCVLDNTSTTLELTILPSVEMVYPQGWVEGTVYVGNALNWFGTGVECEEPANVILKAKETYPDYARAGLNLAKEAGEITFSYKNSWDLDIVSLLEEYRSYEIDMDALLESDSADSSVFGPGSIRPVNEVGIEEGAVCWNYNGNYYAVIEEEMTWDEALEYCATLGGHLATISSLEEQRMVYSLIEQGTHEAYWLGAYAEDGMWSWITEETFEYTNWSSGEPNEGEDGMCMQMFRETGKWDDTWADGDHANGIKVQGIVIEYER